MKVQLYQGDCLAVMQQLDAEKIDLIYLGRIFCWHDHLTAWCDALADLLTQFAKI